MSVFVQIDADGFIVSNGIRVTDENYGKIILKNLRLSGRSTLSQWESQEVFIEAFSSPYVGQSVSVKNSQWELHLPYGFSVTFDLASLTVDEWDRFHGLSDNGIPFVFSRKAQMDFFDSLDSFDDDSISYKGKVYSVPTLNHLKLKSNQLNEGINHTPFWDEKYSEWIAGGEKPGWDLEEVAKPLTEVLPQIKLPKSKICILGCGSGQDAAYLARQGHLVTAVDLSPNAIAKAKDLYGESSSLRFIESDAFHFASKNTGQFDVVFEHTFFCAIDPRRRTDLVKTWSQLLAPQGHLLAIFFIFEQLSGPPFGATEWEIRERLKNRFRLLYWTRWKTSIPSRLGQELIVYAQKQTLF